MATSTWLSQVFLQHVGGLKADTARVTSAHAMPLPLTDTGCHEFVMVTDSFPEQTCTQHSPVFHQLAYLGSLLQRGDTGLPTAARHVESLDVVIIP